MAPRAVPGTRSGLPATPRAASTMGSRAARGLGGEAGGWGIGQPSRRSLHAATGVRVGRSARETRPRFHGDSALATDFSGTDTHMRACRAHPLRIGCVSRQGVWGMSHRGRRIDHRALLTLALGLALTGCQGAGSPTAAPTDAPTDAPIDTSGPAPVVVD